MLILAMLNCRRFLFCVFLVVAYERQKIIQNHDAIFSPLFFFSFFPALLYLNPMLLGSAFATALVNGQGELQQLLAFQTTGEKPVASKSTDP